MALPAWTGLAARHGLFETAAAFLATHGLAVPGLAIPVSAAADWGRFLLALRLTLQILTGFALRRLAVRLGLIDQAAFAGAAAELDPGFLDGTPGALVGLSLVLLAAERVVADRRILPLIGASGTLALLATAPETLLGIAAGGLWSLVRIATFRPPSPLAALVRLTVGLLLGLALSFPVVAAHVLFLATGGSGLAGEALASLSPWEGPFFASRRATATMVGLLSLLPLLALAILAVLPRPPGRRGVPLRAVLLIAALLFVLFPGGFSMLRIPLALLAAIALRDVTGGVGSGIAASMAASAVAIGLGAATGGPERVGFAAGAIASLVLPVLRRRPFLSGAVVLGAGLADALWIAAGPAS